MTNTKKLAGLFLSIGIIGGIAYAVWYGTLPHTTICGTFTNPSIFSLSENSIVFGVGSGLVFVFTGLGFYFAFRKPVLRIIVSLALASLCALILYFALGAIHFSCS